MAQQKFWKKTSPLSTSEVKFANTLTELENQSADMKKSLKNFFLDSVKEVEIFDKNNEMQKSVTVVTIPYICHKILQRVVKQLTQEIEKRTQNKVFFVVKRKIDSKWIQKNKNQKRPRSHTLKSVFENTLEDLCAPAQIIGQRTRCRLDGSKFTKVILDVKDKETMQNRIEVLKQVYKKITSREIVFEFREDPAFYQIRK